MAPASNETTFRVRYGETDHMGGFHNSRTLEWIEPGRTEIPRRLAGGGLVRRAMTVPWRTGCLSAGGSNP